MIKGSCLCGKIKLSIDSSLPKPDACHCQKCRKFSGHFFVSSDVSRSNLTIEGEDNLKWYHSSEKVRRGFCQNCGSSLLFDPIDQNKHNWIAVALGCLEKPTGTEIEKHIFVNHKGDYYEINDDLPKLEH